MITAIVQARMGSARLPGKVMMPVNGRPLLDYMIERLKRANILEKIVVATTNSRLDEQIVAWCEESEVACFQGDENDVLSRYYQCSKQFDASIVVRMTSDCPLIDPKIIDEVVQSYLDRPDVEFSSNTVPLPCFYPDGMDVEVFSTDLLKKAYDDAQLPSEREHVTFFMWKTGKFKTYRLDPPKDISQYRFTVDYPQDFEVIKAILEQLYVENQTFSLSDLIQFMNENPHLSALQKNIDRYGGWQKSYQQDHQFLNSISLQT